jgi:hypothetical protein
VLPIASNLTQENHCPTRVADVEEAVAATSQAAHYLPGGDARSIVQTDPMSGHCQVETGRRLAVRSVTRRLDMRRREQLTHSKVLQMMVLSEPYAGMLVEQILLLHPKYIERVFATPAKAGIERAIRAEARKLVKQFNALPYVSRCEACGGEAVFATVMLRSGETHCWCGDHSAFGRFGSVAFKWANNYVDAQRIVRADFGGRPQMHRQVIQSLARHKGLSVGPITRGRALDFFWGRVDQEVAVSTWRAAQQDTR